MVGCGQTPPDTMDFDRRLCPPTTSRQADEVDALMAMVRLDNTSGRPKYRTQKRKAKLSKNSLALLHFLSEVTLPDPEKVVQPQARKQANEPMPSAQTPRAKITRSVLIKHIYCDEEVEGMGTEDADVRGFFRPMAYTDFDVITDGDVENTLEHLPHYRFSVFISLLLNPINPSFHLLLLFSWPLIISWGLACMYNR